MERLKQENILPSEFHMIICENQLIIIMVGCDSTKIPEIKCSIVINDENEFTLYLNGKPLPNKYSEGIVKSLKLTNLSSFHKY